MRNAALRDADIPCGKEAVDVLIDTKREAAVEYILRSRARALYLERLTKIK